MPRLASSKDLEEQRACILERRRSYRTTLILCGGTGCQASRSLAVAKTIREEIEARQLAGSVHLRVTGCHGFCEQGPVLVLEPSNILYCHVTAEDVPEILDATVLRGEVVERLLYTDPVRNMRIRTEREIPFYRAQNRILLAQNREVDPCSIEDYIAIGGYSALRKVLEGMAPEEVIREVHESGLRGRGGGGFPTGRKWQECRRAPGSIKYVICNADEGDPGAYMDRCLLEGNPHCVLEGMLIGAYAIGAQQGYIYVRKEYPLAVKHCRIAIEQARQWGLLGQNILGSRFSFDVEVARGGGAFVCGESTALMASLEGRVGEPRPKDVHTAEQGLWNRPSNLNNVETWANVPHIIRNGAVWFASRGTAGSKGTKIFALTGCVKNTGLVEVPMGTSLRTIIEEIGGGVRNGVALKAVQTGGPSGGCLPVEKFDLPVDFETLAEAGSMGGLGRHGRHGPAHLHGGRGEVFLALSAGRILRQVRSLPTRRRPHARDRD